MKKYYLKRYTETSTLDYREFKIQKPHYELDGEYMYLPTSFCIEIADINRIHLLERTEREYLDNLKHDILTYGLHKPAVVVFDESGKMRYHDGYHRLIVLQEENWKKIPVQIKKTSRVKGPGKELGQMLPELLQFFA